MIVGFVVFVLLFVQNSFNSNLIKDSVEYNLLYSYNIEKIGSNYLLIVGFKNNGIKALEDIKIEFKSNNDKITNIEIEDTVSYCYKSNNKSVIKNGTVIYKSSFYPSEFRTLIVKLTTDHVISNENINLFVTCKFTNGIKVENAYVSKEINYTNLKLYVNGANMLLWLISIRLVLPILLISLFVFIVAKLAIKIEYIRIIIDFFR
jgi:hypothetical protein